MDKKTIEPIDGSFDEVVEAIVSATPSKQSTEISNQNEFLFYSAGKSGERIRVFIASEDVWITQAAMAEVFGIDKSGVSRHIKNIFDSQELERERCVAKIATHLEDGRTFNIDHYNLDAILSVGYRVNSRKAIKFRQWASTVLKEYLIKGFALDDDRLKQGKDLFGKDYFEELLERIRDIRASEKRFYQKITAIYQQCSFDYDKNAEITKNFFAHAQNKLEFAVVKMTAAEIIKTRVDHKLPNMGLTTWKNQKDGGKIRKSDVTVAKNYLTESEISDLNRLVSMFLDFAENQARRQKKMSMQDWQEKLSDFLRFNEYEILKNYGSITKKTADKLATKEFEKFKPIQDEAFKPDLEYVVEAVNSIKISGEIS